MRCARQRYDASCLRAAHARVGRARMRGPGRLARRVHVAGLTADAHRGKWSLPVPRGPGWKRLSPRSRRALNQDCHRAPFPFSRI